MVKFAPSLMCADALNLERDIRILDKAKSDFYHIDIMDGHFVPNLSLNFEIIKKLKSITATPLDVHLMVESPEDYIEALREVGADYVSFHIETVKFPLRLIREIKSKGMKAGIAVNPSTGLEFLPYVISEVDFMLIMSVEPGFAGQKFIPSVYSKIKEVQDTREKMNLSFLIEVDGSISVETAKACIKNGTDMLVLGTSSIFKKDANLYEKYIKFEEQVKEIKPKEIYTEA